MNKLIYQFIFSLGISTVCLAQNIGIGTTSPAGSAKLDVTSANSGFLPPRLTEVARDGIIAPAAGLMIYNITSNSIEFFNGTKWINFADLVSGKLSSSTSLNKLFGGAGNEDFEKVIKTSDGGYLLAGYSNSSNTGTLAGISSFGFSDAYLVKVDAAGTILWQRTFGGNDYDYLVSLKETSDHGIIIAGYSNSTNSGNLTGLINNGNYDYLVIRLDAAGNTIWRKLFGGNNYELPYDVLQTSDGGLVFVGISASTNSGTLTGLSNNGSGDGWILKLDASGSLLWQKLLGGSGNETLRSVQQTTDGGLIVAGYSTSSNTGTLIGVTGNGSDDCWIFKLDNAGNLNWQKLLGGNALDQAANIKQTSDGGFIVAGSSASTNSGSLTGVTNNGSNDGWICKLDGFGNIQWQRLTGGSTYDFILTVIQTLDGGFVTAGYSNSSNTGTLTGNNSNGNMDYWISKMDAAGNVQWNKLIGGGFDDHAFSIIQNSDGNLIVAGATYSNNTGNLLGLFNYGSADGWLLKLDSYGNPL